MADFHASTSTVSRSSGRSGVAAAAYRHGEILTDHRQGIEHDYTRRSGVVSSHLLVPTPSNSSAREVDDVQQLDHVRRPTGHVGRPAEELEAIRLEREKLWNAAELAEKRKDGRTAREWIIALPAELPAGQRQALAIEFGRELVKRYGVAVDVAIHLPDREGDQRNHHAHVMTTTRTASRNPETGAVELAKKSTIELADGDRRKLGLGPAAAEVTSVREAWAGMMNRALEKAGEKGRVDHRSLAIQRAEAIAAGDQHRADALDRAPQPHLGPIPSADLRRARQKGTEPGTDRAQQFVQVETENRQRQSLLVRLRHAWGAVREQAADGIDAFKQRFEQVAQGMQAFQERFKVFMERQQEQKQLLERSQAESRAGPDRGMSR